MEIKKNEKLNKFINFIKPEKDVIILFLIAFVTCYVLPIMLIWLGPIESFLLVLQVLSYISLYLFAPAICLFIFNKIIFLQHNEKVIKYLKLTKKVLYVIFAFYIFYWLIWVIVTFGFFYGARWAGRIIFGGSTLR